MLDVLRLADPPTGARGSQAREDHYDVQCSQRGVPDVYDADNGPGGEHGMIELTDELLESFALDIEKVRLKLWANVRLRLWANPKTNPQIKGGWGRQDVLLMLILIELRAQNAPD